VLGLWSASSAGILRQTLGKGAYNTYINAKLLSTAVLPAFKQKKQLWRKEAGEEQKLLGTKK